MRYAKSLNLLFEAAKERNLSPEDCLVGTGLSVAGLADETMRLTTAQEAIAIENLVRAADDEIGLGSDVGRRMHVHMFGIWGFAILTSPTLRAAIQTAIKFIKLSFVIADMKLSESDDRARLVFGMKQLPESIHDFILERHATVAITFIKEILQLSDTDPFTVETVRSSPQYCDRLSAVMTVNVAARAVQPALAFPAEWLDKALPKSDPQTLQYCLKQCEVLLKDSDNEMMPWSARVREVLIDHIGEEIKIEPVASQFNVTERTLRRRLTDEGSSFRAIYTDVRLSVAYELLETTGMNTETVSWRVGYAESASFIRAFTKKFGKKPGEIKRKKS